MLVSSVTSKPTPLEHSCFQARRKKLLEEIPEKSVVIIPNSRTSIRSNDTEYKFRPDSDFYYLTGFEEPNSVCILKKDKQGVTYILFVEPKDEKEEIWTGERAGIEGAKSSYLADEAHPIEKFDHHLKKLVRGAKHVYLPFGKNKELDLRVTSLVGNLKQRNREAKPTPSGLLDPRDIVHRMRLIKEKEEIDLIQRAVDISSEAHTLAMTQTNPGMYEYELEALIDGHFRSNGGVGPAYTSIIAAGNNTTTLHYTKNDSEIKDGDLVLIDAGCEFNYYAADITRTFPANRRFTTPQKEIYDIVLDAQLQAIKEATPGKTVKDLFNKAVLVIVQGLKDLKLLKGSTEEIIQKRKYKKFFMHRIGHWLGLDVHDAGPYIDDKGKPIRFSPGMVLTVEPGIYILSKEETVPKEFRGIGVRIEDDVLITKDGNQVLTQGTT